MHSINFTGNKYDEVAPNPNVKAMKGGTDLARQFNLKHKGETGVSVQAAHKWITGRVIPTTDKIKTLAEWLGVTEHWLHYGHLVIHNSERDLLLEGAAQSCV